MVGGGLRLFRVPRFTVFDLRLPEFVTLTALLQLRLCLEAQVLENSVCGVFLFLFTIVIRVEAGISVPLATMITISVV